MTATLRVREAIERTPSRHWTQCCEERSGASPKRADSYFPRMTMPTVDRLLRMAMWDEYFHPSIQEPIAGFIARGLLGRTGVTALSCVPHDVELELEDCDGTGLFEAVWRRAPLHSRVAHFTIMLLRKNRSGAETVWTFFPSEPATPTRRKVPHRGRMSVFVAHELGFEWVRFGEEAGE